MTRREFVENLSDRLHETFLIKRESFKTGLDQPMSLADLGILYMTFSEFASNHLKDLKLNKTFDRKTS